MMVCAVTMMTLAPDSRATLADQLVEDAIWSGPRCTWVGSVVPAGDDRVLAALDPTLYGGLAGVALFLAQMHATLPHESFARTALGALGLVLHARFLRR